MRRLIFILSLAAAPAFAADYNPSVRTLDNSQNITVNYRDRGTETTSHALTYNCESIYSYAQGNSTSTVSAAAGLIHTISVTSTTGAGFIVYDSTHTGDTTRAVGKFSGDEAGSHAFDVKVTSGIQVIGAVSGSEWTISYR